jgi:uncharacterized protein involved in outer membrane biogenesis
MSESSQNEVPHRTLRRIFKILGFLLIGFFIIIVLASVVFYVFRNDIKSKLLKTVHDLQKGEIVAGEIGLSFFSHFPDVSIKLDSLVYYENRKTERDSLENPICQIENFYVAFDILKLLKGKIDVREITLENGEVLIITHSDTSVNIINALGVKTKLEDDSVTKKPTPLDLRLENLSVKDLRFTFDQQISGLKLEFFINDLINSFELHHPINHCQLYANFEILGVYVNNRPYLEDLAFQTNLDFQFDEDILNGQISQGVLKIREMVFKLNGEYDLRNDGWLDLEIDASDEDLTLLSLVVEEDILKLNLDNLKKGDLFFYGFVRGKTFSQIPDAEFTFGAENFHFVMPEGFDPIEGLEFNGYFSTGDARDFSAAVLKVTDIKGTLPGGAVEGSFLLENFKHPHLATDFKAKVDIAAFDKVFKLNHIDSLRGVIQVEAKLDGGIDFAHNKILKDAGNLNVELENLTFYLPKWNMSVKKLDGDLKKIENRLELKNINLKTARNDLQISGDITNLTYLLFGKKADLITNINLSSKQIPLYESIFKKTKFDSVLGNVSDLKLDVSFNTNTTALSNFSIFPEGEIQFHQLSAALENLPSINNLRGNIHISDNSDGFVFDFVDLLLQTDAGSLNVDGILDFSEPKTLRIKTTNNLDQIDFNKIFSAAKDSFEPDSENQDILTSSFNLDTRISFEPFLINHLRVSDGFLNYQTEDDKGSIYLSRFGLNVSELVFEKSSNTKRIFSSLNLSGQLQAEKLATRSFQTKNLEIRFDGNENIYQFWPSSDDLFGKKGEGYLKLDFSNDIPLFNLNYDIKNFKIEDLLDNFYNTSIMSGKANLHISLTTKGNNWKEAVINAEGEVINEGAGLIIYGFDIDKILAKYERSQKFNLADVGAFMLAGPVGAVVSKGSDFAGLVVMDPAGQSKIKELISSWEIKNGKTLAKDVAFSTDENRIAVEGSVDIYNSFIDEITVAVVDKKGCSLITQSISGDFKNIQTGELNVVGTLLGSVINVLKIVTGDQCKPFYTGSINHPKKKKSN